MGNPTDEQLMVVAISIRSLGSDAAESPTIGLADKGRELVVFKVSGDDLHFEFTRLPDSPSASMGEP